MRSGAKRSQGYFIPFQMTLQSDILILLDDYIKENWRSNGDKIADLAYLSRNMYKQKIDVSSR